ncbi:hypothetical protein PENTCL1PPCAC_10255, partial [Pristionchus entomophagus]
SISHGDVIVIASDGIGVPCFFLAIERLYRYSSSEFLFKEDNISSDEVKILEQNSIHFLIVRNLQAIPSSSC